MDFWQRLIAGSALDKSSNKSTSNNPEKRLVRFKREYNELLQTWRNAANLARDFEAADDIRECLMELTQLLSDESRRPLPHPCIAFASAKQIYIPIGKIATTSYNEGIIREAVALFATLIDSEEEDFVDNEAFSKSLMNLLVRITGANSIRLGSETVVEVVELSFNITTKIRLNPDILPAWFTAQQRDGSEDVHRNAHEKFTGRTHKEDFPLFYLLIDYIHEEGRTGDFARTGLLYIIEAASNSLALEEWIVESDLATLMATGLGALYSQLSRKLVIDFAPYGLPPVLALSDYEHPITTFEIVGSASPDFQGHMETFLSHLVFWQDVLNHCKSMEVKQTLLEHFQVIFLQQLLYPSLLESSDVDGGSSVAVLTYLRRILESLDHPDMIQLILHYLLALPETAIAPSGSRTSISAARKRKSMDLATMMASHVALPSTPALFNLVDLIQGSLRSHSQQTVSVTLQLLSVILKRHHRYAVSTLLRISQVNTDGPQRTVGAHEKEMEYILALAEELGGEDNFDDVYENHVKDSMSALESHACSVAMVAPKTIGGSTRYPGSQASIPGAPRDIATHTLRPDDPTLKTLLSILSDFFTNSVETNLSLTATIIDLASCGLMVIDGWLLPHPSKYVFEPEEDETPVLEAYTSDLAVIEERAQLKALKASRRPLDWTATRTPEILEQLRVLVDQVAFYRTEIPRFEDILQQRREAFYSASVAPSPAPAPIRQHRPSPSVASSSQSDSPARVSTFDALAAKLFPDLATPTRARSTRGRHSSEKKRSGSGISSMFHSRGTSREDAIVPPAQFPLGVDTPIRTSVRNVSSTRASDDGRSRSGVPASQAAAFAAIDQGILARKVGTAPTTKAIPFLVPRKKVAGSKEEADVEEPKSPVTPTLAEDDGIKKEVTVSHVLTNVIVLQEFLLELAALIQVRAGLFGEVKFC